MEDFNLIFEKIGHAFKEPELLKTALTHSSYANEHGCRDNERLEFLGDSVLSLIISDKLFKLYGNDEGMLSKMRASLVCEQSLDTIARKISLNEYLRLGKGEERTGGRNRASVVSDAFEAVIAAIYLDAGMETASKWVLGLMSDAINNISGDNYFGDYKSKLQELIYTNRPMNIEYRVVDESGMDHMKEFEVVVLLDGEEGGKGKGRSKKDAEQKAAQAAIRKISNETL